MGDILFTKILLDGGHFVYKKLDPSSLFFSHKHVHSVNQYVNEAYMIQLLL